MKLLLYISLLLLGVSAHAQSPALLSLIGLGSNKSDKIDKHFIRTDDSGFILRISSAPFTSGTFASCHNGGTYYQNLFQKYNADGTTIEWQRCYGPALTQPDSAILFIYPTFNNNFYTIGIHGVVGGYAKYFLAFEDIAQNQIWCGPGYGGADRLFLQTVCRASDGGFFLAFSSDFTGGDVSLHYGSNLWSDIWVLKLDSLGHQVWNKTIGGSWSDMPTRILPAPNGGCYIAGYSESQDYDCTTNNGLYDAFVVRLDSNSNIVWRQCIGSSDNDYAYDATDDGNGHLFFAGAAGANGPHVHNHHGGWADYWLVKMDTSGNFLWDNCFGGGFGEEARAICQSSDGTIWLTGFSNVQGGQIDTSFGTMGDSWTVHADNSGNFLSAKVLGYLESEQGFALHPLPGNSVIMAGDYYQAAPDDAIFLNYHQGGTIPNTDIFFARFAPWTTGIKKLFSGKINCIVYPNPSDKIIHVEFPDGGTNQFSVSVTDAKGRIVFKEKTSGKKKVSVLLENVNSGIYTVKVVDGNGGKFTEKVVLK